MARKRRGRGEGGLYYYPDGRIRAFAPQRTVNGKAQRASKVFQSGQKAAALAWQREQADAGPSAAGTFGDWLTTWLELQKASTQPRSFHGERQTAERHLRPGLAAVKLRDLNALAIERYFARLHSDGVSQNERHKCGKVLRNCLNAATRHDLIPASPFDKIGIPTRPDPKTNSLTLPQLLQLLWTAESFNHGAAPMLRLWADAGLRPGEMFALHWDDFDPVAGTIAVRRSLDEKLHRPKELKTKTSRRTLPIAASTVAALVAMPAGGAGAKMFPAAEGGYWWGSNFQDDLFDPIVLASGIGVRCTPYTLRHTCATLLLQAGVSIKIVSARLGHTSIAFTLRTYVHLLPDDAEKASAMWDQLMERKPGA